MKRIWSSTTGKKAAGLPRTWEAALALWATRAASIFLFDLPGDGKAAEAAKKKSRPPFRRRTIGLDIGHLLCQLFEGDAPLEPCEFRACTKMNATAKAQMLARVAPDIEPVGVIEEAGIAIGSTDQCQDFLAGRWFLHGSGFRPAPCDKWR